MTQRPVRLAAAALVGVCVALPAVAAADGPGPTVSPVSLPVSSATYRVNLDLACPATVRACIGELRLTTARPINPYSDTLPRRRELIAVRPYSIAGGGLQEVRIRMRGPALAELVRSGRLLTVVRTTNDNGDGTTTVSRTRVLLRLQTVG